jgi:hypothetical protein
MNKDMELELEYEFNNFILDKNSKVNMVSMNENTIIDNDIYKNEINNKNIENIWFELKKDMDYYDICKKSNIFNFNELIEKIN